MLTQAQAFWLQFTNVLVAFIGPVVAVIITIWYQKRAAKKAAQMNLFMDLVSFRDYSPLPWQYFVALNRIDVVFHKQLGIRRLWHEYYDLIQQEQVPAIVTLVKEKRIALLSEIGKYLGYRNIDQIFFQRYYQPMGHYNQIVNDYEIKQELLRVLKKTETLYILGKNE